MNIKDAEIIKTLEELGLRKAPDSASLSPSIGDLYDQLDTYMQEIGKLDPELLRKFLINNTTCSDK